MKYIILAFLLVGCTKPTTAERILSDAGYTHINITGVAPLSCHESDWFRTGFTATGPTGRSVTGVVCSGFIFKSATIRLD